MRRFPRGDEPHAMRTGRSAVSRRRGEMHDSRPEGLHYICRERAFDERTGGGRIDTGPDNRQEIVPKIRD